MTIGIVFTCKGRLPLTKLILKRFLEVMDHDFNMVMCYDGNDPEYIRELRDIHDFSHVVSWDSVERDDSKKHTRYGVLLSKIFSLSYDLCEGDYYMHLENDWYWLKGGCIQMGIDALDKYDDVDMVRFLSSPQRFPEKSNLHRYGIDHYKPDFNLFRIGKEFYQWHHNPGLRKLKLPVGRWPDASQGTNYVGRAENELNDRWMESGLGSWRFVDEYFVHIGMFNRGYRIEQGLRQGLGKITSPIKTIHDLYDISYYGITLNELNLKKEYRELYDEYLQIGWDKCKLPDSLQSEMELK